MTFYLQLPLALLRVQFQNSVTFFSFRLRFFFGVFEPLYKLFDLPKEDAFPFCNASVFILLQNGLFTQDFSFIKSTTLLWKALMK